MSNRRSPLRRRCSAKSPTTWPTSARPASCSAGSPRRRSTRASRGRWPGSRNGGRRTRMKTGRSLGPRPRTSSSMASSSRPAPAPDARVLALFGPTASGKTALAGLLRDRLDGEVVSADAAALYAALPVLTAAPSYPARLVGVVPLEQDVSVGEYQRLAHEAIDEILAASRTPIVTGGTGLYFRAALSALEFPPPPESSARARWQDTYDRLGPGGAHALLAERDPAAAARVHANDRRRVVRALELAEAGSSLAPAQDRLWAEDKRRPTLVFGIETVSEERIRRRVAAQVDAGVVDEAKRAWAGPISETARNV